MSTEETGTDSVSDKPLASIDDIAAKLAKTTEVKAKATDKRVTGDGKARADDGKYAGKKAPDERREKPEPVQPHEVQDAHDEEDLERAAKVLDSEDDDEPKPKAKPKAKPDESKSPAKALADKATEPADDDEPESKTDEEEPAEEPQKPRSRLEDAKVFAALKKREKAALEAETRSKQHAQEMEQRARHYESQLNQRHQEIEQREARFRQHDQELQRARSNPVAWLQRAGYTLDDAVSQILADGQPSAARVGREVEGRLAQQLQQIEARLEYERQEREQERQQRAQQTKLQQERDEQRAVQDFTGQIDTHIERNADKYEFIVAEEQTGEVLELIKLTYESTGTLMSIPQAAEKVESFLRQRYERHAKRFGGKSASASEETLTKQDRSDARASTASKTLSNSRTASPGSSSDLPMNRDDALEVLAKKLNANRKR